MEREAVLTWLKSHPAAVGGDAAQLMDRLEGELRRHAEADAWDAAKAHVEDRMHEWEQQYGYHSSEAYAAKQVCPELATELKRMEPHFEKGDEPHLVGEALLGRLEPEARTVVEEWIRDVANEVEHKIWRHVLHYVKGRGAGMVREGVVSSETNWDETQAYARQAARVAQILIDEIDALAPADD